MGQGRIRTPIITRPVGRRVELVSANVRANRPKSLFLEASYRLSQCRLVRFERRRPGITIWVIAFGLLCAQLQVWEGPPEGPEFVLTEEQKCLQGAARVAVARSLDVIGHGVEVKRVNVSPLPDWVAARYTRGRAEMRFTHKHFFDADQLLHTAAHESVHAIFDQAGLNPYFSSPVWDSRLLREEVAAEVLGAHIAGRVKTLRGGDGKELTRRLIREFRDRCDLSAPGNLRRTIWFYATRHDLERTAPDWLYSIAIHRGSVEMVDEMDRICREHPFPWEAAHVIAERFIEPIEEDS